MLNSETLEVAIGMVFLFLLMSLICTAIKEWIEALLKWRAMDLERAMRTLLDDPDGKTTQALYSHPIIYSLFQGGYDHRQLRSSWLVMGTGADRHMRLGGCCGGVIFRFRFWLRWLERAPAAMISGRFGE